MNKTPKTGMTVRTTNSANVSGFAEEKSMPCLSPLQSKTYTRNSTPDSHKTSYIPFLSPQIQREDLSNLSPTIGNFRGRHSRT
jgi:hypothetical protein